MAYIDPEPLSRTDILFLLSLGSLVGAWVLSMCASYKSPKPILSTSRQSTVERYIAGPYPLPLLGNIFTFSALKHSPDSKLLILARKYGKVCMLWFGSNPVIIVNSPQTAKELMDKVNRNRSATSSYPQSHLLIWTLARIHLLIPANTDRLSSTSMALAACDDTNRRYIPSVEKDLPQPSWATAISELPQVPGLRVQGHDLGPPGSPSGVPDGRGAFRHECDL